MGAIIGYHPAYAPNDAAGGNPARLEGMRLLGNRIILTVTGTPDAGKLRTALFEAKTTDGVDLRFVDSDTGGGIPLKLASIAAATGVNIVCELRDANDNPAGELKLSVKSDDKSGTGSGKKINMNVIFPDQADNASGLGPYLEIAAKDTIAIADIGNATNYLAAFKFLSRCK